MTTIFSSEHMVALEAFDGTSGSSLVVSFPARTDRQGLERKGFGQDFFAKRGIPAILVKASWNHWFQLDEVDRLTRAIREAARGYRRVITYGSSMGGYAAARFAAEIDAEEALCISPQFSIDGRKVPEERRWRADAAKIDFQKDDMASALPRSLKLTVVYDPLGADRRHAKLFSEAHANTDLLPVGFGGHPAGAYLKDTKILSKFVSAFVDAPIDVKHWRGRVRAGRSSSGMYWANMALSCSRRHPRMARYAVDRALEVGKENPSVLFIAAKTLNRLGDSQRSIALMREALDFQPDTDRFRLFLDQLTAAHPQDA